MPSLPVLFWDGSPIISQKTKQHISKMIKLIIFDMDGTLTPDRPSSTAAFERKLLPPVQASLAELKARGIILALATNQGGARRGRAGRLTTGAVLAQLRWLSAELGLEATRYATTPERQKPSPAMLIELMQQVGVTAGETLFVGNSETDRQAALAAGVQFAYAHEFFKDYPSSISVSASG